jgi:hypothetical protein
VVQNQLGQTVQETLSQKKITKRRSGDMAQGIVPEFKPHYHKEKKRKKE